MPTLPDPANLLPRIIRIREAHHDGDRLFVEQALEDLEADLRPASPPPRQPFSCGKCGVGFELPGALQDHLTFSGHGDDFDDCERAA
jgi:hypothetical protein